MWLIGFALLIFGLLLLVVGGILFLTFILIPFAIIAGFIGLILLIAGALGAIFHRTTHVHHHYTEQRQTAGNQQYSGQVKYCTKCGTPNPVQNVYCAKCGNKFLE